MFAGDLSSKLNTDTVSSGGPTLRDYQVKGVEWMDSLYESDSSGILADEMGLGKTIQVLSFLDSLHKRHRISGPHLIVMPLSVISSWKGDLKRFNHSTFDVHIHHGEKQQREEAFGYWLFNIQRCMRKTPWLLRISIVITTYEVALKDEQLLRGLSRGSCRWQYLVVDEAHRLKNRYSLLFETLNRIHHSGRRLLLTGTPLQNNLSELWSLLHFILPAVFANEQEFRDLFNQHFDCDSDAEAEDGQADAEQHKSRRDTHQQRRQSKLFSLITMAQCKNNNGAAEEVEKKSIVAQLHELIKPYILRRVKSDVALELPPKVEKIVYCPLSALQREAYELFRTRVRSSTTNTHKTGSASHLADADDVFGPYEKALMNVNNLLMQLRKLCNHPYLVLEDVKTIPDALYYQHLIQSSGKLFVLDKLLTPLLEQGSKVLIFSQMTSMLDILQGYLQQRGINCARLDGNTPQLSREHQLRVFNRSTAPGSGVHSYGFSPEPKDEGNSSNIDIDSADIESEYSVFLLSTRAGGVGINLQAADTVILFDSDWNPQQDLQAISRAHRIGQTRPVLVLRLVSAGPDEHTYSVEQRILRRAGKKLEAERQVLANGVFDLSESSQTEQTQGRSSSAAGAGAQFQGTKTAHTFTREACESPAHARTGPESLQESMLSLFETITDSESVSTDGGSARSTPIVPAFVHIASQAIPSRRICGAHTAKSNTDATLKKVIDMYMFDFSEEGIEDICHRQEAVSPRVVKAASSNNNHAQKELITLVKDYDKKVWRSWLHPESVDDNSPGSVSKRSRSTPCTSSKYALRTPEVGSGRRNLRGPARSSGNNQSPEGGYSASEQPIYQFGRKRKASEPRTARSNHQNQPGRHRDTGNSSEEGTVYEDSDDSDAVSCQDAGSPSPVQLQEDDICALCNQAWVTPAEVQAFLDLKLQSLLHRAAPTVVGSPLVLSLPLVPCTALSLSGTPMSASSGAKPAASVTPPSSSASAANGTTAVNSSRKRTGAGRGAGRGHSTDALLTLMDAKSPEQVASAGSKLSPHSASHDASSVNDMLKMMILCDGCDGSYHMICVGLEQVPQNDWYCQPCRFSLT